MVDEEPAVESDNSGDAEDGASKGKGSDHLGMQRKMRILHHPMTNI